VLATFFSSKATMNDDRHGITVYRLPVVLHAIVSAPGQDFNGFPADSLFPTDSMCVQIRPAECAELGGTDLGHVRTCFYFDF